MWHAQLLHTSYRGLPALGRSRWRYTGTDAQRGGWIPWLASLSMRFGLLQEKVHAWYVRVGLGQSMIERDLADGKLTVKLGFAAVQPAKLIVLGLHQPMPQ